MIKHNLSIYEMFMNTTLSTRFLEYILNPFTIQNVLLLLPIGFYSLTHMALRGTFIWILMAIIFFKNSFKKNYS